MADGIFWDGAVFLEPGIKTKIDKTGTNNTNVSGVATLALIGDADSGTPFKLTKMSGTKDAINFLKDGALLQAYIFANDPSPTLPPAQNIAVMNIRNITQAYGYLNLSEVTKDMLDTFEKDDDEIQDAQDQIKLLLNTVKIVSNLWGTSGNKVKLKWDTSYDEQRRYIIIQSEDTESDPIDIKRIAMTAEIKEIEIPYLQVLKIINKSNTKIYFDIKQTGTGKIIEKFGQGLYETTGPIYTVKISVGDYILKKDDLTDFLSLQSSGFAPLPKLQQDSSNNYYFTNSTTDLANQREFIIDLTKYENSQQVFVNKINEQLWEIKEELENIYNNFFITSSNWVDVNDESDPNNHQYSKNNFELLTFKSWLENSFGFSSEEPTIEEKFFISAAIATPEWEITITDQKFYISSIVKDFKFYLNNYRCLEDLISDLNFNNRSSYNDPEELGTEAYGLRFTKHHKIDGKSKLLNLLDHCQVTVNDEDSSIELLANRSELISKINQHFNNIITAERIDYNDIPHPSQDEFLEDGEKKYLDYLAAHRQTLDLTGWEKANQLNLAGGQSKNGDIDRWQLAFETLELETVDTIVGITSLMPDIMDERDVEYSRNFNDAVHQLGKTHVTSMAVSKKGKRRRYIASSLNPTLNNIQPRHYDEITAAYGCNRVILVGYGMYDYDYKYNSERLFHPSFTAAKLGSMICGSAPQCSMTSQQINGIRPEGTINNRLKGEQPLNQTEIEELLKASVVLPIMKDDTLYVLRSLSTWRENNNFYDVEPSVLRCCDFSQNDAEKKMNVFRIQWLANGYSPVAADIMTSVEVILREHQSVGWIVNTDTGRAFSGISASINGDTFYWDVNLQLPIPKNFGFGTAYLVK